MSHLVQVSKSKYRAVVSDILPYERPIFFSNRFFARFLKHYGVVISEGRLVASKNQTEGVDDFLQLMGGEAEDKRPCFQYTITKDGQVKGRELSILHPFHQVEMVELYEKYKLLMVYYCQRSSFSIRYPYKVATYQKKQKGFHHMVSDTSQSIYSDESIKHFFAYRHYHNINAFYDDYRFLRAEKKYSFMRKLDVEKCFESINPTLLSKAMFAESVEKCLGTLPGEFCRLQLEYGQERGIVIGPEFSRIYAEIVMQKIDLETKENVEKEFKLRKDYDYVFYRYVDDGFLFSRSKEVADKFQMKYAEVLSDYGLKLQKDKCKDFTERPFLGGITYAKTQLIELVDRTFENRLETFKGFKKMQSGRLDTPTTIDYLLFIKMVRTILQAASVLNGETLKYKDILSFLLGLIQKRLDALLLQFNNLYRQYAQADAMNIISEDGQSIKRRYERDFLDFLCQLVEVLFYLLSCDLRMNTSIKVVSIINRLQLFVRGRYKFTDDYISSKFPTTLVARLDERITDETQALLHSAEVKDFNVMEILNVLELQKLMTKRYQLKPLVLHDFIEQNKLTVDRLNFFTVFELLHFIKTDDRYDWLADQLYSWIEIQLAHLEKKGESPTEAVLTFMEVLCCPWTRRQFKEKWAGQIFKNKAGKVLSFAKQQHDLFIRWRDYQVGEEILHFNGTEVY